MSIAYVDGWSYNRLSSAWRILQKLSVVLLDLEGAISQDGLDLLMVKALLSQHSIRKCLDLILMQFHQLPCFFGALLDDPNYFFVDLCSCFLAVDVVAFGVDRRVVGERVAHAETGHHLSGDSAHLLQVVRGSTRDLCYGKVTSLKKCYSEVLPPRITHIWSYSCLLFMSDDSLGKYCANPSDPLERGTIVILSSGAAPSENQATTACPASW